jgi:hypothetical protein
MNGSERWRSLDFRAITTKNLVHSSRLGLPQLYPLQQYHPSAESIEQARGEVHFFHAEKSLATFARLSLDKPFVTKSGAKRAKL